MICILVQLDWRLSAKTFLQQSNSGLFFDQEMCQGASTTLLILVSKFTKHQINNIFPVMIAQDPIIKQLQQFIIPELLKHQYKKQYRHIHPISTKIVLQVPQQLLVPSIQYDKFLRQALPASRIYLLYDCNKKSCCTDIVGARHVDYDALIHIGYACFSEKSHPNHYYVFPAADSDFLKTLELSKVSKIINQQSIDAVIVDQSLYHICAEESSPIRDSVLRLPLNNDNSISQEIHFALGYYNTSGRQIKNLMLLGCPESIIQKILFMKGSLQVNRIVDYEGKEIVMNLSKSLMKRLSLVNQLREKERFGIIVSNPNTEFCQQMLRQCRSILKQENKIYYTFMMSNNLHQQIILNFTKDNLNQAKLGNFQQIECYVIISCYNHSLYQQTDFYTLLVTPFDLVYAFTEVRLDQYDFDCRHKLAYEEEEQKQPEPSKTKEQKSSLEATETHHRDLVKISNEVDVTKILQVLSIYEKREFKGLDHSQKKQATKATLGKIGLAQQYKPLQPQ